MPAVTESFPARVQSPVDHPADDELEAWSRGELAEAECASVEEHLMLCETCQERLQNLEAYAALLRDALLKLNDPTPPEGGGQ